MVGVAGGLLTSTLVFAQGQKPDTPATETKTETVVEKKVVEKKVAEVLKAGAVFVAPAKVQVRIAEQERLIQQRAVRLAMSAFANANDNLEPLIQQFTPQFRNTLRIELHFLLTVCAPTEDQRKLIAVDGEAALKEAAKKFAEMQQAMMQGRWRGNTPQPDPRKIIQDALARSVKTRLSPEQAARYQAELEQRKASRKEVAVRNLVAKLDHDLFLADEQREKLVESLSKNWNDAWCQSLDILVNNEQYFPNIPNQYILPFLNPTQKKVWSGTARNGAVFFGGQPGMMAFEVNFEVAEVFDAIELAVPVAPAPPPAAKQEVKKN
jgi:hypothetical protein